MVILFDRKTRTSVNSVDEFAVKDGEKNLADLDRYEVELAFSKLLDNGDIGAIAEDLGKSPTLISQWLNPNNERVNPLYKAIGILVALLKRDRRKGTEAVRIFNHFCGRFNTFSMDHLPYFGDAAAIRKRLFEKWELFVEGEIEGFTAEKQVATLEQIQKELSLLLHAKRREIRRSHAKQTAIKRFGPLRPVGK